MNKVYNLSVITIVFNDVSNIERTILSVINQSYKNFEYIIIDGGSTDGTVDIISKYKIHISTFISERDSGIYDAMNKGIDNANGNWLIFMNCGDEFYDRNVLSFVFSKSIPQNTSLIYGKTLFLYPNREICIKNSNNKYMPACHQSIFVLTRDIKSNKFDLKYKVAADYSYFYNLYQRNSNYFFVDTIISRYDAVHGFSSENRIRCFNEITRITYPPIISTLIIFLFRLKQFIRLIYKCLL